MQVQSSKLSKQALLENPADVPLIVAITTCNQIQVIFTAV